MGRISRAVSLLALGAAAALSGCASEYVKIAAKPPENFTRLGPAKGSACGHLALIQTSTTFIPIAFNGRIERAYDEAVKSVPGATGLVDVKFQEDWVWWLLATSQCVTITGEAVK